MTRPIAGFYDSGRAAWQEIDLLFRQCRAEPPSTHLRDQLAVILSWARYGRNEADAQDRQAAFMRLAADGTHYET